MMNADYPLRIILAAIFFLLGFTVNVYGYELFGAQASQPTQALASGGRAEYRGVEAPALITKHNALTYSWMIYEMVNILYSLATIIEYIPPPQLILSRPEDFEGANCEMVNLIDWSGQTPAITELEFRLDECMLGAARFLGRVQVAITDDFAANYPSKIAIENLKLSRGLDALSLSGRVHCHRDDGLTTKRFVLHSKALQKTFMLSDFKYSQEKLIGFLYDSEYGKVTISQGDTSGELVLEGVKGSWLLMKYPDFHIGMEEEEAVFEILFHSKAPGMGEPISSTTVISVRGLRQAVYGDSSLLADADGH